MVTDERVNPAALGFDANAGDYERGRPSYPAEAVALVVGRGGIGPGRRVLDLAAGTGKMTRLLLPTGADVVAVEPVAGMRAALERLAAASPGLEVLDGTAENLPLPDGSVDAVTVAQAFHWFDPPVALAEMRRVLRPGGHLFLVWNVRDREHDWVRTF
ncbi:MAG TPA: class I SAM-dependent methyltransferase, partial [Acidimicrobiales bacterium]